MNSGIQGKRNDFSITLIAAAFVLQMFFFAPIQVLAKNFSEFSVLFTDVLLSLLLIAVILMMLLAFVLEKLRLPVLLAATTCLSVTGFLESRFLLTFARHNLFDGTQIDWGSLQWLSWLEAVMILFLAGFFMKIRRRTDILSAVSLFILLFLTAGLVNAIYGNYDSLRPNPQDDPRVSPYLDQFNRLSTNRNVIHIVPDQAQGAMVHDILNSDLEHYSQVFDGFSFFTQAVGRYKGTYPSVVYYMSGDAPEADTDHVESQPFTWDYVGQTLEEHSIVTLLADNGFNTFGFQFQPGIFCKGSYTACTGTHDEVFAGIAANNPKKKLALTVLTAIDLGLFQMTPVAVRKRVFDDGRWLVRRILTSEATHSGILDVFTEKMQVGEFPDTYNYIHHAGAHAPVLFDRNCEYIGPQDVDLASQGEQARCTLTQLGELIEALKANGVYDQTMIVINGDHGTPWLPSSFSDRSGTIVPDYIMGMASVFLMIKPPGARGSLEFSDQPVTMGDIPATIAGAFDLDHTYPGVQIFKDAPPLERERYYFTYDSSATAHSSQSLDNLIRYRIRGDLFDERDWVLPGNQQSANSLSGVVASASDSAPQPVVAGRYPSQLNMDHPEFEAITEGFSWVEQHSIPARWVDGVNARVLLSPPVGGPVNLVFGSYVPPSLDAQKVEITINGRQIAELGPEALRRERHVIPIPADMSPAEGFDIAFEMAETKSTPQDPRLLSILFWHIGLEPAR